MTLDPDRLRRLIELGRTVVAELDLDALLQRIIEVAREETGARYAALGVLDASGEELERFLVTGIDAETYRSIGDLPRGRGVLGALITDPRPLRLADVGEHPRSYGFPPGHPPMHTFLGVPVRVRGEVFGNLYLTDKAGGPFTEADEEAVVILSDWAAIGIDNARRHRAVRGRRDELERAVRGFEATTELARAIGGETEPQLVLDLIVKRARAMLDGRAALLFEVVGEEVICIAAAGHGRPLVIGQRRRLNRAIVGDELQSGRIDDADALGADSLAEEVGARSAVYTPLRFRGATLGILTVYGDDPFSLDDERSLVAFSASAASAVATAQNAASRALRLSIEAAENERRHWARELHDQTLQELGALRMLLSSARRKSPERLAATVDDAVDMLAVAIAELRLLITELRPAALDQLGVAAALETLIDRTRKLSGVDVDLRLRLASDRQAPDLESTMYRIVQEALTNVVRHADATRATIHVTETDGRITIDVRDDGAGFSTDGTLRGFGLVGMQERAALVGGQVRVESAVGRGTRVVAELPVLDG